MQAENNNCFLFIMEKLIEHIGKRDGTKQGTHSHKSIPTYQIQLPGFVTTQLNPSSPTRSTGPKCTGPMDPSQASSKFKMFPSTKLYIIRLFNKSDENQIYTFFSMKDGDLSLLNTNIHRESSFIFLIHTESVIF